ncbi:MAG: hypothetical protein OXC05_07325 [Halieaceae bacterium]|nr:hypothetical protein [Halieaceae bacterium]
MKPLDHFIGGANETDRGIEAEASWPATFGLSMPSGQVDACRTWWTACTSRPSYHKAITAHEHPITLGTRRLQELKAAVPAVCELLEGPPELESGQSCPPVSGRTSFKNNTFPRHSSSILLFS